MSVNVGIQSVPGVGQFLHRLDMGLANFGGLIPIISGSACGKSNFNPVVAVIIRLNAGISVNVSVWFHRNHFFLGWGVGGLQIPHLVWS
jgi:hypothetical protein